MKQRSVYPCFFTVDFPDFAAPGQMSESRHTDTLTDLPEEQNYERHSANEMVLGNGDISGNHLSAGHHRVFQHPPAFQSAGC